MTKDIYLYIFVYTKAAGMFPRKKGRLKMDKNKKEYMLYMEVSSCISCPNSSWRANFFFIAENKIDAINKALSEINVANLRIIKIFFV